MTFEMNILTFDIEDWFHVLDNPETEDINRWNQYESRVSAGLDFILETLNKLNSKATFFCLGWVAEKYPEIVRRISDSGFEIASHSYAHDLVYGMTPEKFRTDMDRSIKILEDLSGKRVNTYRAPGFSITEDTKWAFEVIAASGIEVDCSVFPAKRGHGGFPTFPERKPCLINHSSYSIKELPVSYYSLFGIPVVYSGGGYFRLVPYCVINYLSRHSDYTMTYFHPRDFDADYPEIPGLSRLRRFKTQIGTKSAGQKLYKWIESKSFIDVQTAISLIDWKSSPTVNL
jgi:peptidoglycan-N-acetylglucosamine deacetylase